MQQIVDLYNDPDFQALNVALVSIARDSLAEQSAAIAEYGIPAEVPLAADADTSVSGAYDVLQYALPDGEPSHTFVLVSAEGDIVWMKDYGAPNNPDRTMYVEPEELINLIKDHLP